MWPESTTTTPKQFLPLVGSKSTLRVNYEQIAKFVDIKKIWVLTTVDLVEMVKKELPEIDGCNYVVEPCRRNHGPAISMMMAKLVNVDPDEPFMIIQTDVIRNPESRFREMIMMADEVTQKTGCWLTAGKKMEGKIAGVDYVEVGNKKTYGEVNFWEIEKWLNRDIEKDIERAISNQKALIHATHLCWTPIKMIEVIKSHVPSWGRGIDKLMEAGENWEKVVKTVYKQMEHGSFEERVVSQLTEKGYVMEMTFEWWDLGTWESVADYNQKYFNNNNECDMVEIEAGGNYCRVEKGKKVAVVGMDNLIVVDTPEGLLVCKKEMSGRVGEVITKLEEKD